MRKPIGKIKNASVAKRVRRKLSIRKKIEGDSSRPRICVNKTNKHIRVQVIDDQAGKTVASVATYGKNAVAGAKGNVEGAKLMGKELASKMTAINVNTAVFDRSGFKYTGIVAALADSIRENGIKL